MVRLRLPRGARKRSDEQHRRVEEILLAARAVELLSMVNDWEAEGAARDAEERHIIIQTDPSTGYVQALGPYPNAYAAVLDLGRIRDVYAAVLDPDRGPGEAGGLIELRPVPLFPPPEEAST